MSSDARYSISYGKAQVPFYRVYARPLTGLKPIPESAFVGRDNTLFAGEIDVEVFGDNFLPAYLTGDNSSVVATDSMKNIVLREALNFDGATIEAFLNQLGQHFLTAYPQMESLRLTGRQMPFAPASVPAPDGVSFAASGVLFARTHGDQTVAQMAFARDGARAVIGTHRSGRVGLELLKVTGSAFTHFVRDDYTTLPERRDRPLFIFLDVYWTYSAPTDALANDPTRYVAAEQVRDVVQTVFHEFVSESIQHLTHEMGQRLLARFPQIASVSFEGQNRTPDPVAISETDPTIKVYSTPFPAYGLIRLTMTRPSAQDAAPDAATSER